MILSHQKLYQKLQLNFLILIWKRIAIGAQFIHNLLQISLIHSLLINIQNMEPKIKKAAKIKEQDARRCESCFEELKEPKDQFMSQYKCCSCKKSFHRHCYLAERRIVEKDKFFCDPCTRRKTEATCYFCQKKNGLMKVLYNDKGVETQDYVHVLCALNNTLISVQSYSKLQFTLRQKSLYETGDSKEKTKKCHFCYKLTNSRNLIKCSQCNMYAHIICLKNPRSGGEQDDWALVYELMDKNKFMYRNIERLAEQGNYFKNLKKLKFDQVENFRILCADHSTEDHIIFCPCGQKKPSQQEYGCDFCKRWLHNSCSGIKKSSSKLKCKGCIEDDIFQRQLILPEFVNQMVKIQKIDKDPTKQQVYGIMKVLDAFPYEISDAIVNLLKGWVSWVEKYYLGRLIEEKLKQNHQIQYDQALSLQFLEQNDLISYLIYCYLGLKAQEKEPVNHKLLIKQFENYYDKITNSLYQSKGLIKQSTLRSMFNILATYNKIKQKTKVYDEEQLISKILHRVDKVIKRYEKKSSKLNHMTLSMQIEQIARLYQKSELEKLFLKNVDPHYMLIFLFLVRNRIQRNNLQALLKIFTKSLLKSCFCEFEQEKPYIHELDYYNFTGFLYNLPKSMDSIYQEFVLNHVDFSKIHRKCLQKDSFIQRIQNIQAINNKSPSIHNIHKVAASQNIVLPKNSQFSKLHEQQLIYLCVKKNCLKEIDKNKSNQQISVFVKKVKDLLENHSNMLTKQQINKFKAFICKNQFHTNIIALYDEVKQFLKNEQSKKGSKLFQMEEDTQPENIDKQVEKALRSQMSKYYDVDYCIELLSQLSENKIQLNNEQMESAMQFTINIIQRLNQQYKPKSQHDFFYLSQSNNKPKAAFSRKIANLLEYTGLKESFYSYIEDYELYIGWIKPLENFPSISGALQQPAQVERLIAVCNQMILAADSIQYDIRQQMCKLHTLQLWCDISRKFFDNFFVKKRRATISAIQQFKDIIQISKYPHNSIRNKIIELDIEARMINKKVAKFFQRPKYQIGQMEYHQEVRYFKNKLSINEVKELYSKMQRSALEVSAQTEELGAQIAMFQSLPFDEIPNYVATHNLTKLIQLKKALLQHPIRPENQNFFQDIIKKIAIVRAQTFAFPVSKKQVQKIIQIGGSQVLSALQRDKASQLIKAYKLVEKAQKEIFITPRNQKNLLQLGDERRLKQDLQLDPTQKANVQKWFNRVKVLRDRFGQMKNGRVQLEKLRVIQQQLARIPINCKDISDDIQLMKKQVEQIYNKMKNWSLEDRLLKQQTQDLLRKYKYGGLKQNTLQKYLVQFQAYRQIMKRSNKPKKQIYRDFSIKCQKHPELTSVEKVWQARYSYFLEMYKYIMNPQNTNTQYELTSVLLEQGCDLIKIFKSFKQKEEILEILLQISKKKTDYEKNQEQIDQNKPQDHQASQQKQSQQNSRKEDLNPNSNIQVKQLVQQKIQDTQLNNQNQNSEKRKSKTEISALKEVKSKQDIKFDNKEGSILSRFRNNSDKNSISQRKQIFTQKKQKQDPDDAQLAKVRQMRKQVQQMLQKKSQARSSPLHNSDRMYSESHFYSQNVLAHPHKFGELDKRYEIQNISLAMQLDQQYDDDQYAGKVAENMIVDNTNLQQMRPELMQPLTQKKKNLQKKQPIIIQQDQDLGNKSPCNSISEPEMPPSLQQVTKQRNNQVSKRMAQIILSSLQDETKYEKKKSQMKD